MGFIESTNTYSKLPGFTLKVVKYTKYLFLVEN